MLYYRQLYKTKWSNKPTIHFLAIRLSSYALFLCPRFAFTYFLCNMSIVCFMASVIFENMFAVFFTQVSQRYSNLSSVAMSHAVQMSAGDGSHLSCVRDTSSMKMNHHAQVSAGDGSHQSCVTDAAVVAFAFYNLGIINNTFLGKKWNQENSLRQKQLRQDIANIFRGDRGMQCLFLCEFGEMSPCIDVVLRTATGGVVQPSTQEYFEKLVDDINLPTLSVHAIAPYVALIDSTFWDVNK